MRRFDGVVTARSIDTGQLIDTGAAKELFHMQALNTLRVYTNVPQLYTTNMKRGSKIDITFPEYPGRTFQGTLVRTADAIDPSSRTLLVEIDVDNRKGELLPGSLAQVHFKAPAMQTFIIPVSAIIFRREGTQVGTVGSDNVAHVVPVTIGQDDGATVQIVSGLKDGDRVIQDPPDSLIEGEKVSPENPSNQQKAGSRGRGANSDGFGLQIEGSWLSSRYRRRERRLLNERLLVACLLGLVSLLAGCKVGPNYQRPDTLAPPEYKEGGSAGAVVPPPNPAGGTWKPASPSDGMLRGKWWEVYQDPQLNALEEQIAPQNQSLRAALETYLSARDQVRVARADFYPTLSVTPAVSRDQVSTHRPLVPCGALEPDTATFNWRDRQAGSRICGVVCAGTLRLPTRMRRRARPTWRIWT